MLTRRTLLKNIAAIFPLTKMEIFSGERVENWLLVKTIHKINGGRWSLSHYRIILEYHPRRVVFATSKHLILTRNRGWLLVSELKKGDAIHRSHFESDGTIFVGDKC